ncbi:histone deacetylase, putative [Bodo saltans]|uniref:Histone deacetylase, putative n=1 Tax=Bodo saltans TaxID=75058 RepID=A0A0S4JEE2_BODSA|nr:histone deacetylase, putative [Bodo saltans]|eukprot:CUG89746.1 histone deacetylase, putative [Bodo saltans]
MAAAKRAREGEDLSTHPNLGKLRLYVQRWHSNVHPATVFSPLPTGDERNGLAPPTSTHKLHTAGPLQRGPIPFLIQPTMERHANVNTLAQHPRRSTRQTLGALSSSPGTGFAYHPDTLLHERVGAREVERPERVGKTFEHLSALGLISLCTPLECKRATTKQLARVHTERHIDTVDQWGFAVELSGEQACVVGGDLYASAETSRAARLAAGGVTEAALAVARGDVQNAFALVRPPGHHCSSTTASGFCFFNNVAVAVRAAQHALELQQSQAPKGTGDNSHDAPKAPRILIVDWDVHHCDGTEEVFYNDPSVCVFSIHQYGSKPQHTLRRRHQPAVTPTEAKAPPSIPDTTKQDITFDELLTGIDDDDLLGGTDAAAQTLSVAPVVVAEESGDENRTTTTRPRRGGTIDFKALNATFNASDRDATAFFASAGLLKETTERIGNLSSSSSSASVGTRDDDDDTSSGFDDDDSSASVGGAKKKERFDGDEDGATSTEEDVDRQSLFYPGTGHVHRTADDDESAAPPPAAGRNIKQGTGC